MKLKKFLGGAALTALTMAFGAQTAQAQSTGAQAFEEGDQEIVVTGERSRDIAGLINAETAPKARATVTQDYIETQAPGQTILESLNLVPGVVFSNNDAYGSSGGSLNIRGFDGARVSLQFDGAQLNDTGNYAIYSNQQLDPELIEAATVNLGATDVDSPTASATGGTVNYRTRLPGDEFGGILQYGYGTFDMNRVFAMVDTGPLFGTDATAFVSLSSQEYDHFLGNFGGVDKAQFNARVYYPLEGRDFLSLAFHYNENRNNFIRQIPVATFNASGLRNYAGNLSACQTTQAAVAGVADSARSCSNVGPLALNPSNTGNIRGQGRFTLAENLTLTVDPTFQYVLANGGSTLDYIEGGAASSSRINTDVDLNGDGDLLDRVLLFQPNTTTTQRWSLQTSLIWDINPTNRLRFSYTYDRGRHRQVGQATRINADSTPVDVFSSNFGYATPILDARGAPIRRRDRVSYAILNQFSLEYRGDFMDDLISVTAGLRLPYFERELNNNCFQGLDFNGNNPICTTSSAQIALLSANPEVQAPFRGATVEYDDILPNFGITFRPADGHQIFFSYAEGLSAPRTDDLYGRRLSTLGRLEPETSTAYDLGYRYRSQTLIASATAWFNQFENRIERTFDQVTGDTGSFNVGGIDLSGADFEIGYVGIENLTLVGTASYKQSEIGTNIGTALTQGRSLYETPEWTYAGRVEYDVANWSLGVQARHVGERFTNLTNTQVAPDYTVVDANARWSFGNLVEMEGAYLQFNVVNLFDEEYLGNISTNISGNQNAQVGAPRTFLVTLRTAF